MNSKIYCPTCVLTPKLTLNDLTFNSECLLNHKHQSTSLEYFLSNKIKEEDYKCLEHESQNFFGFCKKCNKNICSDCFEGHEEHENNIIFFHKLKLKKQEYEEYKKQLELMRIEKEKIEQTCIKIKKLKELINELSNLINKIYENTNSFNNKFQKQLLFNKAIYESYNIKKLNYNMIMNIKSFNFNKDEINKFQNSSDTKKMIELSENLMKILKEDNKCLNTFITPKYCPTWGLNEAIREILQNQIDEIVIQIGGKDKLVIEKTGKEIELYDKFSSSKKKMHLDYIFKKKNDDKIFGEIKYNKEKKELTVSNIGNLETGDLLFGCEKGIENRKDIIGRFGEGMKLAALTFYKLNKKFLIKTNGEIWKFNVKKDKTFIKHNESQECLFWQEEKDLSNNTSKGYIEVIISEISPEEWLKQTDNYLWLNQREMGKIKVDTYLATGEIMLGDFFKRKLYVKDSYVETTNDSSDLSIYFGFNLDIELDRDRKCVLSTYERNNRITKIIAYVLNNFEKIRLSLFEQEKVLLDQFPEKVYNCLHESYQITRSLYYDIEEKGANLIWSYMIKKDNSLKDKYPSSNCDKVNSFIEEKNLPKEFYPCFQVSYQLGDVLEHKKGFLSIEQKYDSYLKKVPIEEIPIEYNTPLKEICEKLIQLDKSFSSIQIKFKQFQDKSKNTCYKEGKIFYFSSILLKKDINKEWKCFILGKYMEMLCIQYSTIISFFNLID